MAGVPATIVVTAWHAAFANGGAAHPIPKVGSLQEFVQVDGSAEEWSPR